jgi:hypothetical protein
MKLNIAKKASAATTAPITATTTTRPEFLRLPRTGTLCGFTGLSRSYLNSLVLPTETNSHKPPVRSVCLRQPGAARGVRLIVAQSLFDYLNRQGEAE